MIRLPRYRRTSSRGQSMVELAMILPVLLLIVLGTLEFGFIFDHHLTLEYATREGARTGSALANGGGPLGCGAGQSPNAANVDPQIVAAVERVLTSPGAEVKMADIARIRLYRADAAGNPIGGQNIWVYAPGAGPVVDGAALDFRPQSVAWSACARNNVTPDSIGVDLDYTYRTQTALPAFLGWSTVSMTDRTVMALNPTAL